MLNKFLRYLLFPPLILAMLIYVSALALTGIWVIEPGLIPAILAITFATVIEGEVYKENIWEGLKQFFHPGSFIKHALLKAKLDDLAKEAEIKEINDGNNLFYIYAQLEEQKRKLKKFHPSTKLDREEKQNQLRQIRTHRSFIYNLFKKKVFEKDFKAPPGLEINFGATEAFAAEINKKVKIMRAVSPAIVLSGIGSGLLGAWVSMLSLNIIMASFSFTLGMVTIASILCPLALLFMVGSSYIMYKTFNDVLQHRKFYEYKNKLIRFFKGIDANQQPQKRTALWWSKRVLAVMGISLLVFIAVAAALATGGTAWWATKRGAILLPTLARHGKKAGRTVRIAAEVFRDVVVPAISFSQIIFALKNSAVTIDKIRQLPATVANRWRGFTQQKRLTVIQEWTNPFRVLTNVFELLIRSVFFVLHISSIGVTTDHTGKIPPYASAGVSAISEGLVDVVYVAGEDSDQEDDHHHADLAGIFTKTVLAPLYILSGLWHYAFHKLRKRKEGEEKVGFIGAMSWSFGIHRHESKQGYLPQRLSFSKEFQYQSLRQKISDKTSRLEKVHGASKVRNGKIAVWKTLEKELDSPHAKGVTFSNILVEQGLFKKEANDSAMDNSAYQDLARHRHHRLFRTSAPAQSIVELEQLREEYGSLRLP